MLNSGRYSVMSASSDRSCLLSLSMRVISAVRVLVIEPIRNPESAVGAPRLGSACLEKSTLL